MRILIDLQACQSTGSRTRGIGRYSLSLLKAMLKQSAHHEVRIMLNAMFPESVNDLRKELAHSLPKEQIHVWQAMSSTAMLNNENKWKVRANELIREQALSEFRPDIVHVTSLFEGLTDDAVTSVGRSPNKLATAVTLYDLIPLINAKPYLENDQVRSWYYRKIQDLKQADLLLAISESSRQEGIDWLHLPSERIVNISSAVDERFSTKSIDVSKINDIKKCYGLTRAFVMYTGGIDLRKNIEGLIRAFAALPNDIRQLHQLAIVCSAQAQDKERLSLLAKQCGLLKDELVMTGYVPDEDLPVLYHACDLFVFPSWHEGFGLPALEAMACGAPVIAANTSSLPEVMGWNEALFNPYKDEDITRKMAQALSDPSFKNALRLHGIEQAKCFSWDKSAKIAIDAFEDFFERANTKKSIANYDTNKKPRLAYFSPLPPERSGIADYSAELLPELAKYYDIDLIVDQEFLGDPYLASNFSMRHWQWFDQHAHQFDRVIYSIGNSTFHTYMMDMLEKHPGVVVLHDFYHSGLIAHLEMSGQRPGTWNEALYRSHGYKSLLDKSSTDDLNQIIWDYPCNQFVLDKAEGVIVHSSYSIELAKKWYGKSVGEDWNLIPHLRVLPKQMDKQKAREILGLNEDSFLLCSFGILGPTKLNRLLLDAWLSLPLATNKNCYLVFVGLNDCGKYGLDLVETIGDNKNIKITGFADLDLFRTYLQAADAAVQLRAMSRGETSGTVLDCMAYGLATIVNNNGSMKELPEHALIKLDEEVDVSYLAEKIKLLFDDPKLRQSLGEKAIAYLDSHHAPSKVGEQYYQAIENNFSINPSVRLHQTINKIAQIDEVCSKEDLIAAAEKLNLNRTLHFGRRVFIDLAALQKMSVNFKLILENLIQCTPASWRVEPIQLKDGQWHFARDEVCALFNLPSLMHANEIVDINEHDVVLHFSNLVDKQCLAQSIEATLKVYNISQEYMHVNFSQFNRDEQYIEFANNCWKALLGRVS